MSIPQTVVDYLADKGVAYDVVNHPFSNTSLATARTAGVAADVVAKAVVLAGDGEHVMAVLPADLDVDMKTLRSELDKDLQLVSEEELNKLFKDCAPGAIPAVGPAYGMYTVVDTHLRGHPQLYFEAGDHEELIRLGESDFERLLEGADFYSFAVDSMA